MLKLKYVGVNWWGRVVYRDDKGKLYSLVDGAIYLNSPSDDIDGEPCTEVRESGYGVVIVHWGVSSITVKFKGKEYEICTDGVVYASDWEVIKPDIPQEVFEYRDKYLMGEV